MTILLRAIVCILCCLGESISEKIKLLLVTDVSTTLAEVIFKVK